VITTNNTAHLSGNACASLLASTLEGRGEMECTATQDAIDALAAEFRDGRAGLIAALRRDGERAVLDACGGSFGPAWYNDRILLLATGRTFADWFCLPRAEAR
jgi:hypothetical protein